MSEDSAFLFWTDADGAVRRTKIGSRPVTIGSSDICIVSLPADAAATVHGVIEREHGRPLIRRLSRTRPLEVNGEATDEAQLSHGDRVRAGDADIVYLEPRALAPRTLRLTLRLEESADEIEVEVAGAMTVIGRAEGDLLIEDASVSRQHLEIENFGDGLVWVRDLDSTNGSELNGEPLTQRRPLLPGDLLKAGRILIRVNEGNEPPEGLDSAPQQHVSFGQDHALA
ncbi:MAG: FHA domain-containing protein [Deltaproteobacteria bacterium]|nr:FHA domain-containing protein [Deltaproteobacteria bacterium]MCB9786043.1 FHA domain-containing protein [Deltaproteobacteria bacterium]